MKNRMDYEKLRDLVVKVKLHDDRACSELYHMTYHRVYQIVASFFKSQQEIEDVIQEVYMKIFSSLSQLNNDRAFVAWMNRLTYNTCISVLGQGNFREIGSDEELEKLESEEDPTYENILKRSRSDVLADVLWQLDTESRMILMLRYVEEFKVREIATIMAISEGTVKSRIHRSKKKVKELLGTHRGKDVLFSHFLFPSFFGFYMKNGMSGGTFFVKGAGASVAATSTTVTGVAAVTGVVGSAILVGAIVVAAPNPSFAYVEVMDKMVCSQPVVIRAGVNVPGEVEGVYAVSEQGAVYEFHAEHDWYQAAISENGVYTLSIVSGNQQFEQEQVVIDCIDHEGPMLKESHYDGTQMRFVIEDQHSKIEDITIFAKGVSGELYYPSEVDSLNNMVIFEVIEEGFVLTVKDKFGIGAEYEVIPGGKKEIE